MIAHVNQYRREPRRPRRARERDRREKQLRFCVVTAADRLVELRYFRHPQDAEGVTMRLTPQEGEALAHALATPGAHFIQRDDKPDAQGRLAR